MSSPLVPFVYEARNGQGSWPACSRVSENARMTMSENHNSSTCAVNDRLRHSYADSSNAKHAPSQSKTKAHKDLLDTRTAEIGSRGLNCAPKREDDEVSFFASDVKSKPLITKKPFQLKHRSQGTPRCKALPLPAHLVCWEPNLPRRNIPSDAPALPTPLPNAVQSASWHRLWLASRVFRV